MFIKFSEIHISDICRVLPPNRYVRLRCLLLLPVLVLLPATSLFCQSTYQNGMVARFDFNEASLINEITGGNIAKAPDCAFVRDRFSNTESALYLQGNFGSYVNLGTASVLKPRNATLSIWFNIDNPMFKGNGLENNPIIITKCQPGDDFYEGYYLGYDVNLKKLCATTTYSNQQQITLHTSDTIELRRWHHAVMCYDDNFLTLYINGKLSGKVKKGFASRFLESDSVMIGNTANTKNKRFLNGTIDDIRVYNRVLSADEVMDLYTEPNPNKYKRMLNVVYLSITALVVVLLLALGFRWYFKRRYKKKLEKIEMNNRLTALEVKAIRAQMDPHFIFNALNSIQQFIVRGENEEAQIYLSKFSRLIRKMLETNTDQLLSVANELDILNKYLEMELLRFEHVFSFEINVNLKQELQQVFIPHFIIQPFVENAIWHGLLTKKGEKRLSVLLEELDGGTLFCRIEDNGIGRIRAGEKKLRKNDRSFALEFTRQRLEFMKEIYGGEYGINLLDKPNDTGTVVEIRFPFILRKDRKEDEFVM